MTHGRFSAVVVDVVAIGAVCAAAVLLSGFAAARAAEPLDRVLAPSTAAVGAAAAVLGIVVARLTGERRPASVAVICSAQVLYSAVVLPVTALPGPTVQPALPHLLEGTDGAGWAGAAAALVVIGWTVAALDVVIDGLRRGDRTRLRGGLGLAVVASAYLRQCLGAGAAPGLLLVGLVLVLGASARLAVIALRDGEADRWQCQDEATAATVAVQRMVEAAAERDHELRNGLAGLSGITELLSADPDLGGEASAGYERLRHSVRAELGRLRRLLEGPPVPDGQPADEHHEYLVQPVLTGLAVLRPDAVVTLDVADGLAARGDPAALAQVMTNLLANCERHAPGSPVSITARETGGEVVVEVCDRGPGLAPGAEREVLRRGVHDAAAGGAGLGLDISARLVERQGGTLTLRTVDAPRGCLVTVTLPGGGGNRLPTQKHRTDFHRV